MKTKRLLHAVNGIVPKSQISVEYRNESWGIPQYIMKNIAINHGVQGYKAQECRINHGNAE